MKTYDNRTLQQNRALHKYCELLAEALNDAGYDMRKTLKHDIEIPWNKNRVKEFLWKPIMETMTDKESTAELDTVEPSAIHAVLSRHLGEKLGVYVPWPSKEDR